MPGTTTAVAVSEPIALVAAGERHERRGHGHAARPRPAAAARPASAASTSPGSSPWASDSAG